MSISAAILPNETHAETPPPITGASLPMEAFQLLETDIVDANAIADVLDGKRLGVICRDVVAPRDRAAICDNFWRHEGRYTRGSDAPAEYLGAYHYAKPTALYLEQSQAANAVLPALFEGVTNPVAAMKDVLSAELTRRSRRLRAARHDGLEACAFVMRSWSGTKSFALAPHEDAAQCTDPLQAGFEIQEAAAANALAAVNICLQNGDGGTLRLWNIRPDTASRAALGLAITGSPYPLPAIASFPFIDVPIRAGDLYVFDGRFLHAVTSLDGAGGATGQRATIAFLMAHLGGSETICWT